MTNKMIIVFILSVTMSINVCAPAEAQDDSAGDKVSAQTLYDVANEFNLTMLNVISKAMLNLEKENKEEAEELCRLHPCSKWSNWSDCDFSVDKNRQVGAISRTRLCGGNTTLCKRYGITKIEIEHKVCEKQRCPSNYTTTKNGFCLKYYAGPKLWDEAEAKCRSDGGHLVNVDSEVKAHDVNLTLPSVSNNHAWIDGRKSVQGEPWSYGYESTDPAFTYWGPNEPNNGPTDLCMLYYKYPSLWRWYDTPCSRSFQFVCEVVIFRV